MCWTQQPTSLKVQAEFPEPSVHLEYTADEHSFLDPTSPCFAEVARAYLFGKMVAAIMNSRIETQPHTWDSVLQANPGISKVSESLRPVKNYTVKEYKVTEISGTWMELEIIISSEATEVQKQSAFFPLPYVDFKC